jgi:dTDP-4-amino-4,6-dideoxygalactose transaminase
MSVPMSSVPMSDLWAEHRSLQLEIEQALQRVIKSGIFVLGAEVEGFEQEFAAYCGATHAVGVGSGTAALQLAMLACNIGPGDEVITVPNTDIPTTAAITHCGASIVWVDVDPETYTMDPAKIVERITPRTKAILPVHLFGHPADMDPIAEIAREHGLLVIEDAALAVGTEYKGRKVGTFGVAGCFSLAPTKILGAYGDGGVLVTNDPQIAERIRILRNYGHSLQMEEEFEGSLGTREWRYDTEGFNERLDSLQAAVVRAKLPSLEDRIARRRQIAEQYRDLLAGLPVQVPRESPNVRHVYFAYAVLVDDRELVRDYLASQGIANRIHYIPPLHLQAVYRRLGFNLGDYPVVESVAQRMISLPIFPQMTDDHVQAVTSALRQYFVVGARR